MHSKTWSKIGSWFLIVISLMAVFGGQRAQAQSYLDMTRVQAAAQAFNTQQSNSNSVYVSYMQDGTRRYASGVLWGDGIHVLTSAHVWISSSSPRTDFQVGNGTNWMSDPGMVVNVTSGISHPGYNAADPFHSDDLAILTISTALPASTISIGSLTVGTSFYYSGFGRPGTASGGYLPLDGQGRVIDVVADAFGDIGIASEDYVISHFYPPEFRDLPLGGVGTPGSSGGGGWGYNSNVLYTLATGQVGSPGLFSETLGLELYSRAPWVYTNVPAPGTLGVLMGSMFYVARRKRN